MWENIMALWKIRKGEFALYLSMTGIIWLFGNLFSGLMKKKHTVSRNSAVCYISGSLWRSDYVCDWLWNRSVLRI